MRSSPPGGTLRGDPDWWRSRHPSRDVVAIPTDNRFDMLLGLATIAVAVVWAAAGGRGLDPQLPRVRWLAVVAAGLVGQVLLDRLAPAGQVQVAGEVLSLSALLAGCIVNSRLPGMVALAAGVVANAIAIVANAGMPVSADAVRAIGGSALALPPEGHHHLLDESSNLAMFADTLGVGWLGVVISPGDALLVVGAITLLAACLAGDLDR